MVIYAAAFDPRLKLQEGIGLYRQGRLEEAWGAVAQVLAAEPANAVAYQMRGLILVQAGQAQAAAEDFRRAVALAPADPAAHNNLSNILRELGRPEEALASADRALQLEPRFDDARFSRGNALLDLARIPEALEDYDAVLRRQPGLARAWHNRGLALRSLNRADLALDSFRKAMALDPGTPEVLANCGGAYLALGRLPEGFALFEARWRNRHMQAYLQSRAFAAPFWRGDVPLAGKTLLLHSEQGFGDVLQFCRYAALAAEQGARVLVEVDPSLAPLMRSLAGADQAIAQGEPLPSFDLHCPVMSLPYAFRTTLETVPGRTPYLAADPAKAAAWAARLGPRTRPRVGLVWSSGARPDHPELKAANSRRDLPFGKLRALKGLGLEFHSLQKGQPAEGAFDALDAGAWDGPAIANHAGALTDFSETAALIQNLDLVLTVDTSVLHLAGALHRPVWGMNRFDPCWRWLQDRADSPWYPTLRLFRQPRMGDWDAVLAEVIQALRTQFAG